MNRSPGRLWDRVARGKTYDLAQPLEPSIPFSPNHPGFKMALLRRHGDMVRADGGSASNEMMFMGGHSGTHIDALCHVSHDGCLHGGIDAHEAQAGGRFKELGVETIEPMLCRGVLLDIAALRGVEVLPPDRPITRQELEEAAERQEVEIRPGDAVLIRSGWPAHWQDPATFLGATGGAPGPDEEAAQWLAELEIRITGGETIAYEWIPPGKGHALLPVHRVLLVEAGIHIIEVMNLTALAKDRVFEFLFVLTPLKVVGATGVPVRPMAVSDPGESA